MKKMICIPLLLLFALGAGAESESAAPAPLTGREIVEKQKELHQSRSEYTEQHMILIDRGGGQEVRTSRNYVKEIEPEVNRLLVVFTRPAGIRGTALLTWQHKDREDDQWLYLPARGAMQRIVRGSRRNYFMGTDFTYEDLQSEALDNFSYTLLRQELLEENSCHVIEAVPLQEANRRESGYSKRLLWIDREHFRLLKIEFYDRRERLLKTQINRDWVNVRERLWRPQRTLMENHQTGHQTLIGVIEREVDKELDDQIFTERFILTGRHLQ